MDKKTGRPSEYTKEIGEAICEHIANGNSLRSFCEKENSPSKSTVLRWLRQNEDFQTQYALSRQQLMEMMAEDIIEIADDGSNDYMTITKGNVSYNVEDREVTNRSRLRVDTRKWIMSKLLPRKYGDKIDVTSDGKAIKGNTIVFEDFKNEAKS